MSSQINPKAIAESCMCLSLRRASRLVSRRYDEAFRPLGINSGQFTILMAVHGYREVSVIALADELDMDRTTLTAVLKPLERDGLLEITCAQHDRRSRIIMITTSGKKLLQRATPLWQKAQDAVMHEANLGSADVLRKSLASIK